MTDFETMIIAWALSGAAIAQVLVFYFTRKHNRKFSLEKSLIISIASAAISYFYFYFVDSSLSNMSIMFHYSFFVSLTIDATLNITSLKGLESFLYPKKSKAKFHSSVGATAGVLIVTGVGNVYLWGCIGALITESAFIARAHRATAQSKRKLLNERTGSDWGLSVFIVLISGLPVIAHGIYDVSALTAMQLGISGPLVKKAWTK
ncbi:hypothetical protein [Rheinheimera sp.]|uniref:hypothetical protein n=1 Tax=Rheinheimera sp. TaxID=1869214 RepID=UPI00307F42DB